MPGQVRCFLLDTVLAAVLTGLTVAALVNETDGGVGWLALALAVFTAAPIALRQQAPVVTMGIIVAALAAHGLVGHSETVPNGGVGLLIAMFTVATLRSRRVAAAMFLLALAVTGAFLTSLKTAPWPLVAQAILVLAGAWALGESTKRWGERVERLAAEAASAVAEERVRIARELHDIVAHHMSVISLQAGVAEYVIDTDVPTAKKAIGTVGEAGREALLEMRRLLDVLRVEDGAEPGYLPQPGLAMLDELVGRMSGAGLPVEVAVTGRVRDLPPGTDLCAYRVVQESLTNVLKHAGTATARIDIDYGVRTLTIDVTDDGARSRAHRVSPTAHGIRGMRERAELYGGVLTAGPAKDRGFAVVARLPLSEDA